MAETIEQVMEDAQDVFQFVEGTTHQTRAHAYIERRGVHRQPGDTATLCAVRDMVTRASRCNPRPPSEEARIALSEGASYLLNLAVRLGD